VTNQRGCSKEHPGALWPAKRVRWAVPTLCLLSGAPASASGGLVLVPDPWIYVPLLIGFVLLVAPLNALIFRPIFRVLDERDQRITGARKRAAQLSAEAETLTTRYRDEIRQTREEAERGRKEQLGAARSEQGSITDDARSEAEDEISRAREEIAASLEEARASLQSTSQDLAKVAAEQILGRAV